MSLTIDVFADVVCPWCWVGERHLEQALEAWGEEFPDAPAPVVRFMPFELNPDMPAAGMSRHEYLDRKFGPDGATEIYSRIEGVGRELGIDFRFADIEHMPNTLPAHLLLQGVVDQPERQAALFVALMRAFFVEARDLTQTSVLVEIASSVGIDPAAAHAMLADQKLKARTTAIEMQAREIGVQGVPFFIINRRLGVSGAQPPEALLDAMRQAQDEAPDAA